MGLRYTNLIQQIKQPERSGGGRVMSTAGNRSSLKFVVMFVIAFMLALMGIPNHASAVEEPTNKVDVGSTGSKSINEALTLEAGNEAGEKAFTFLKTAVS